ncbi:hypothetical protein B0H16DRAFT_1481366 [Mycena metata]|uniref:Uncharacterized protein n=1 Tax=Mycena metata TaxID=1033252 RepID=A0AAD7GZ03_9AGAR|nr:hypothetical protein B0H16DRAFT_1481366 [Mycena metata]
MMSKKSGRRLDLRGSAWDEPNTVVILSWNHLQLAVRGLAWAWANWLEHWLGLVQIGLDKLAWAPFNVQQHELKEPLNLNGDLVNDLWDNSVITCGSDGKAALQAMYAAVNDGVLPGANESQKMSRFFDRHTIFDSHWRPPLYRRVRNSQFASTEAVVTVSTVSKRKAEEQLDSLKGPKRSKLEDPKKAKVQQKTKKSGAGAIMAVPGNNRRILPSRKISAENPRPHLFKKMSPIVKNDIENQIIDSDGTLVPSGQVDRWFPGFDCLGVYYLSSRRRWCSAVSSNFW